MNQTTMSLAQVILCVGIVFGLAAMPRGAMTPHAAATQPTVEAWEGALSLPRRPVIITLRLQTTDDAVRGTIQFAGQQPIPVSGIRDGDTLTLNGGDPRIALTAKTDGATLIGTLSQGGQPSPFRLSREPDLPRPANRSQAWNQDLHIAARKLPLYDRSLSPDAGKQYQTAIATLLTAVDRKSDAELIVGLARAIALAGNAHTRLYILRNRTELRRLPLRLWWFGDNAYVVRTTRQHQELVGCRVTAINGHSAVAVRRSVAPLFAGNASWQAYMSAYSMTSPEVLAGLGLLTDPESLPWQLECGDRTVNVVLHPLPLRKRTTPTEAWWDLSPAFHPDDGAQWVSVPQRDPLPLYLRHPDRYYWHEYLPDRHALYVQYFRAQTAPSGPSLTEYVKDVVREMEGQALTRVVIDLRFNTGGDAGLGRTAMEALRALASDKRADIVVISGRATFSAGLYHLAEWKALGARIVGEPAGDELDFWAEGGNLILPTSGLYVHYANGFHAYSTRDYPALKPYFSDLNVDTVAPDVMTPMTWEAYRDGEDPALSAALQRQR
jgi:hypothetical protein